MTENALRSALSDQQELNVRLEAENVMLKHYNDQLNRMVNQLQSAHSHQQSNYIQLMNAVIGDGNTTSDVKDVCAIATQLHVDLAHHVDINCQREVAMEQLRADNERLHRRVAGELSDTCPFCEHVHMDGTSQQSPMCGLCQAESDRDSLHAENERLRNGAVDQEPGRQRIIRALKGDSNE